MEMYPEKPKRTVIEPETQPRAYRKWLGLFLAAIIGLPVPVLLLLRHDQARTVDMLLLGVMICSALYILYQGMLWLISQLSDEDLSELPIE